MSYKINEYTDDEWSKHKNKTFEDMDDVERFVDSYEERRQELEDEINRPELFDEIMDDAYSRLREVNERAREKRRQELIKIQNSRWWKPWTWRYYFDSSV